MIQKKHQLIFLVILAMMSPLVINAYKLSFLIYPLLWLFVPIFLYGLLPAKKAMVLKIFVAIIASAYFINSLFFALRHMMCAYSSEKVEYENIQNKNVKLVGRYFSCYGTLEELVLYKQYSISNDIKYEFYYETFIDSEKIKIDTTIWKSIDK